MHCSLRPLRQGTGAQGASTGTRHKPLPLPVAPPKVGILRRERERQSTLPSPFLSVFSDSWRGDVTVSVTADSVWNRRDGPAVLGLSAEELICDGSLL